MIKKSIFIFLIILFSLLIYQVSKDAWVDSKLSVLRQEFKSLRVEDTDSFENSLERLQRLSPRDDKVWFLSSRYYFRRMRAASTNQERRQWIEKSYQAVCKALENNPLDPALKAFRDKTLKWKNVFSS